MFLACRRGTEFSREAENINLSTPAGYKQYFDYNTQTVGTDDIGRYVDAILNPDNIPDNTNCNALQIVTHGLGAGEVYSGLAGSPTWRDKVSHVTNISPCLVPTYLTSGSKHRMLAEKQDQTSAAEPPRELEELLDMPARKLWHRSSNDYYWYRVERYCNWYPHSCYNYCDWYPSWCDPFCARFPQFCKDKTP